jgi:hypothetical protein
MSGCMSAAKAVRIHAVEINNASPLVEAQPIEAALPLLSYQQGDIAAAPPDWTNLRTYTYKPDGWHIMVRQRVLLQVILVLVLCPIILAVQVYAIGLDAPVVAIVVVLMVMVFAFRIYITALRETRRSRDIWPTFRLILADQGVFRACKSFPTIALPSDQIREIRQDRHGLAVVGSRSLEVIYVVANRFDDFPEIRGRLEQTKPFVQKRTGIQFARNISIGILFLLANLGLFMAGMFSQSLPLELVCLVGVSSLALWTLIMTWRSPNISTFQRRRSFISLSFPAVLAVKIALLHEFLHF